MSKKTKIKLIVCCVSLMLLIISGAGLGILDELNVLWTDEKTAVEERTKMLQERYSLWALDARDSDFHIDEIEKTNLHLGVIVNDKPSVTQEELKDIRNYTVENFDEHFDVDNLQVYDIAMHEEDFPVFNMNTILGYADIFCVEEFEETTQSVKYYHVVSYVNDKIILREEDGFFLKIYSFRP